MQTGVLVLMGGYDGSSRNDVWRSDNEGAAWRQLAAAAPWVGRYDHAAVSLQVRASNFRCHQCYTAAPSERRLTAARRTELSQRCLAIQ